MAQSLLLHVGRYYCVDQSYFALLALSFSLCCCQTKNDDCTFYELGPKITPIIRFPRIDSIPSRSVRHGLPPPLDFLHVNDESRVLGVTVVPVRRPGNRQQCPYLKADMT